MSSLADLFSPTFLIFLGILILVACLIVVYFENKVREQNHRIASMLSLVSTLAEDVNGIKFGLNHLAVNYIGGGQPLEQNTETNNFLNQENLIPVSDDEEDDEEDDDDDFEDDESNTTDDENSVLLLDENNSNDSDEMELIENEVDSDSDSEYGDKSEVKVLKINISNQDNDEDIDNLELETSNDLNELTNDLEEPEILGDEQQITETPNFDISNLKTINIHLEENKNDATDYKKLSIQKLRSIVSEKGLAGDTSKLKKQDLFKLLGVE